MTLQTRPPARQQSEVLQRSRRLVLAATLRLIHDEDVHHWADAQRSQRVLDRVVARHKRLLAKHGLD